MNGRSRLKGVPLVQQLAQVLIKKRKHNTMNYFETSETATLVAPRQRMYNDTNRANQILDALITTTSQQEYDEVTVEKLIREYESLMS